MHVCNSLHAHLSTLQQLLLLLLLVLLLLFRLELGSGMHQGRGRLVVRANDGVLSAAVRSELYAQLSRAPVAS